MRSLRYLYVLALVLWLGGMAAAGFVVAPAVFGVLQTSDPVRGRMLAGEVFGEVLRRLNVVAYTAGAVMFVVLTVQRVLGPRPKSYGIRVAVVALMLALTGYIGFVIAPRIRTLQGVAGIPMIQLPADDPRRVEFDGLHSLSTQLMGAAILGGLVLVAWETRE